MIGPRLKELIDSHGWLQKEIAIEVGISAAKLNRMLNGSRPVTIDVAVHVTRRAGITLGAFLGETGFGVPPGVIAALDDALNTLRKVEGGAVPPLRKKKTASAPDKQRAVIIPLGSMLQEGSQVADADAAWIEIPSRYARLGPITAYQITSSLWRSGGIERDDILFVLAAEGLSDADGRLVVGETDGVPDIARLERLELRRVRLTSARDHHPQVVREVDKDFRLIGVIVGRLGALPPW
jgi:transcriptional regulator with XRE-family HTH domain